MTAESLAQPACSSAADLVAAFESTEGGRPIMDPATGELVGRAPEHSLADLETAVAVARGAQPGWASRGHAERRGLRMGNTVVMKPSEHTPWSVLALVHVLSQVLPEGVLHVVAGRWVSAWPPTRRWTRSCSPAPPPPARPSSAPPPTR